MNVVLVHAGLRDRGGVTVDVRNLERGLQRHNVPVTAVATTRALVAELRRRPGSLVHVFGCLPSPAIFASLGIARSGRSPLVWTPVFHPSRPRSWRGYGLLRAMEAFDRVAPQVARLVGAVVAATEAEAEFFRTLCGRVVLIPPGVEKLGPTEAPSPQVTAQLGLAPGPAVVTVARDNSRKALPFGLAVFRELRRRRPNTQLLLVGPPAGFGSGEPGIVCPGWLDPADVEHAFRAATALWVPSLYEGLPRVIVEAWSFGRPVVATDRVALAPLVSAGRGHVVRYGDIDAAAGSLATLLGDPAHAAELGAAGRMLVAKQFLLGPAVEQTLALYREVEEASRDH